MHYPTDIHTMNQDLKNLTREAPRVGLADLAYRARYEIRSVCTDPSNLSMIIANQRTPLLVRCREHDFQFVSNRRKLFNRSLVSRFMTCPFCDVAAGYSAQTLHTYTSLSSALMEAGVPFKLDPAQVSDPPPVVILKSKEQIPLACTNLLPDGTVCGYPVRQTVNNILTTVQHPGHLRCQGPCDAKRKGKARRVPESQITEELRVARSGTYSLVPGSYVKKTEPVLMRHEPCCQILFRDLELVLTQPGRQGLPPDNSEDCVFCTGRAARVQLSSDPDRYREWLLRATAGAIEYRSGSLAVADMETVPVEVTCLRCGTEYTALELALRNNVSSGCPTCTETARHVQRAWDVTEAQDLVARRGFHLEDDPENYAKPARIVTAKGIAAPYATILELVRSLPATATGFGKPVRIPLITTRHGQIFSAVELEGLRQGHREQRTKVDLCRELGRSYGSLSQKCKELGLRFDQKDHVNRRMVVDDWFFHEPTPRSAYWGGLLAADGCLGKEVTIELKAIDEAVLQQLQRELGHPGALSYRVMTTTEGRGLYCGLRFRSKQIRRDLEEHYRLTIRKSLTLCPPDLTEPELVLGYVGGLLDGDGSIALDRDGRLRVGLVGASLPLITWVQEQVASLAGVAAPVREEWPWGRRIYALNWYGGAAERLLTALAAVNTSPMRRKWDIWALSQ